MRGLVFLPSPNYVLYVVVYLWQSEKNKITLGTYLGLHFSIKNKCE